MVSARENLKVAIGARDVAAEFLKLSQKQLELGALSLLDIYNPQQQLATNEVSVAQARFRLLPSAKTHCVSRSRWTSTHSFAISRWGASVDMPSISFENKLVQAIANGP